MARTAALKIVKPQTLGSMIDDLTAIREEKRALAIKEKDINGRYDELEKSIVERLAAEGMDKATGKAASVSVGESICANLTDWDALTAFIKRNNYFHLLHKRISEPAFRELLALKGVVPGLTPYTKITLNLRNL